jgi:hypothetical protein
MYRRVYKAATGFVELASNKTILNCRPALVSSNIGPDYLQVDFYSPFLLQALEQLKGYR